MPLTPDAIGVNCATPSGHRDCYMLITVTMPGGEAHSIVQSQDGIHVMINYLTDFLPGPIPMMVYA